MIEKVIHTADLHIRTYIRHEEYKEQFVKFLEMAKEEKPDRITIVGDIVHSKIQLTPELISMVSWFLNECSKIAITVITIGNHDFIATNLQRLDALTPIIDAIDNDRIVYLKHTGCYLDENVVWCVYGQMEESERPNIEEAREKYGNDKTYVGLYHDPVIGLKTTIGFEFEEGQDISIFEGTDMVMCGDIHKRQHMDYRGTPIVQVGSMIQQGFGESPKEHGFLVWDIDTRTYIGYDIPTDYGYYTITVDSIDVVENGDEEVLYV